MLHFYRSTLVKNQEKRQHDSARNNILWEFAKKQAAANGNDLQIEKFMNKTLTSPSIIQANDEYVGRLMADRPE